MHIQFQNNGHMSIVTLPEEQLSRTVCRDHFQDPTIQNPPLINFKNYKCSMSIYVKKIRANTLPRPRLSGNTHRPCQNDPLHH